MLYNLPLMETFGQLLRSWGFRVVNLQTKYKVLILPCLCSWGRKSDQWEGSYLILTASDYWSAGKTVGAEDHGERGKKREGCNVNTGWWLSALHCNSNSVKKWQYLWSNTNLSLAAQKRTKNKSSKWSWLQFTAVSCFKNILPHRGFLRWTIVNERLCRLFCWNAYSPRLVAEIVDGVQRVDRGDACVLQTDDQVPEILVLGHTEGVLAHQDEVRPERPGVRAAETLITWSAEKCNVPDADIYTKRYSIIDHINVVKATNCVFLNCPCFILVLFKKYFSSGECRRSFKWIYLCITNLERRYLRKSN